MLDENHAKNKDSTNNNIILRYIFHILNFNICWMVVKKIHDNYIKLLYYCK